MKLSKKFIEDLHQIGERAFIEKNMWIGKLVPDIIVDNLLKRGISHEDIEGCVILSVEEAKEVLNCIDEAYYAPRELYNNIEKRIAKAEAQNEIK